MLVSLLFRSFEWDVLFFVWGLLFLSWIIDILVLLCCVVSICLVSFLLVLLIKFFVLVSHFLPCCPVRIGASMSFFLLGRGSIVFLVLFLLLLWRVLAILRRMGLMVAVQLVVVLQWCFC